MDLAQYDLFGAFTLHRYGAYWHLNIFFYLGLYPDLNPVSALREFSFTTASINSTSQLNVLPKE
jgi:hypothetical protein